MPVSRSAPLFYPPPRKKLGLKAEKKMGGYHAVALLGEGGLRFGAMKRFIFWPQRILARKSRSLIAAPSPVVGIGMTAMPLYFG